MPQCPHCEEQLQILDKIVQNSEKGYRVVNVSPKVSDEMIQKFSFTEWVEDRDLELQKIFKIHGSPTLYIWGSEGRISRVILGIPDGFKETLERYLPKGKASS
jgi:thiol-disulfide isomerase/thioredoxin